jgi:hypothetical protein
MLCGPAGNLEVKQGTISVPETTEHSSLSKKSRIIDVALT